ncbi:MAG: CPBP family intramembrane glutamic endopeptidase [Nocardioides sp.]
MSTDVPPEGSPHPARWDRFELGRFVHAALVDPVPRDHLETTAAFRRRRIVVAVTIVIGASLLGVSLSLRPGDNRFYVLTVALALTWVLGTVLAGPVHLGWAHTRTPSRQARPVVQPLVLGLLMVGVFAAGGGLVVARVPFLREQTIEVLDHARFASLTVVALITLVNGLAEELFFRGALFAALRGRQVLWSTVLYTLATVATGNPMLVFAAALLGLVVGLQRRVTGGVLGPMLIHVIWSLSMLLLLPVLVN